MGKSIKQESIKISKIEIVIGEKKLELTPDEAMSLKKVLNEIFPDEKIVYVPSQPIIIKEYEPYPIYPSYPYSPDPFPWWQPSITCGTNSAGNTLTITQKENSY